MITPKRTSAHLPTGGILAAAVVSCILATLPLAAQDRSHSRPSDSSDHGGGRTAHESHGSYAPSSPSPERSSTPPPASSSSSSDWRRSESGRSSGDNRGTKPRTAVPVAPGSPDGGGSANRQPPTRRDDRGRGGHSQYGHYGGGYYPYGGYGYYPYGSFWWNVFWGYPYYYDFEYPRYRYGYGSDYRDEEFGALDLDVSPDRTQVYLDGQYIGTVDDFDGWPRYLWLEKGTYDLALYLDGYKTDARQISVYPGLVIAIDDHMEPGESIKPQDLLTKTHDRRDTRQRYESERQEELDRRRRSRDDDEGEDEWRSRSRRHRVVIEREEASEEADGRDSEMSEVSGSGTVKLNIEPDDASVYLDGKFIGTGADLAKMAAGMPIEAGDHKVSVVRPGRKDENVSFKVKAGAEVEVEIELEERGGS